MKKMILKLQKTFIAGLIIASAVSCEKTKMDLKPSGINSENPSTQNATGLQLSSRGKGGSGGTINYSDTFILLSFTQKNVQKLYASEDVRIEYDWSAAGESNISYIELIIDGTTSKTDTITTSSNYTQYHTFTTGFIACKGTKNTVSAKLKITYKSGKVIYSSNLYYNYVGGFCCKCWQ